MHNQCLHQWIEDPNYKTSPNITKYEICKICGETQITIRKHTTCGPTEFEMFNISNRDNIKIRKSSIKK